MTRIFRLFVLALVILNFPQTSRATFLVYVANLTGPGESPPNTSTATGAAEVDIDTVANTMHVHVTFSGLGSPSTASHIHSATPLPGNGTAGVATTTPSFTGFPLGVTSGTFDSTLDLTQSTSYNPAFVTANGGTPASAEAALLAGIAAGEAYLNIHSANFPSGEIRGFLVGVPEPSSLVLLGSGALGLLVLARRRAGRSPE